MNVHVLQHVPFEGPACIAEWAQQRGHALTTTRLFADAPLPDVHALDRLVVLGGPMGVHDEAQHPWLAREKAFVHAAIEAGRSVVGICLGAQLVAHVLGTRVYANAQKEIGWFPVELTEAGQQSDLLGSLPSPLTVFHWHGDTFDLPEGAVHLARSAACEHQAFLYGDRVLGLQFHPEATMDSVRALAAAGDAELKEAAGAPYVQPPDQLTSADPALLRRANAAMHEVLDRLPA